MAGQQGAGAGAPITHKLRYGKPMPKHFFIAHFPMAKQGDPLMRAPVYMKREAPPADPRVKKDAWTLSENDGLGNYTGMKEETPSQYVAFVRGEEGEFLVCPIEGWYNFKQKITHKTLTIEEAEEKMKDASRKPGGFDRWMMRNEKKEEGDREDEIAAKQEAAKEAAAGQTGKKKKKKSAAAPNAAARRRAPGEEDELGLYGNNKNDEDEQDSEEDERRRRYRSGGGGKKKGGGGGEDGENNSENDFEDEVDDDDEGQPPKPGKDGENEEEEEGAPSGNEEEEEEGDEEYKKSKKDSEKAENVEMVKKAMQRLDNEDDEDFLAEADEDDDDFNAKDMDNFGGKGASPMEDVVATSTSTTAASKAGARVVIKMGSNSGSVSLSREDSGAGVGGGGGGARGPPPPAPGSASRKRKLEEPAAEEIETASSQGPSKKVKTESGAVPAAATNSGPIDINKLVRDLVLAELRRNPDASEAMTVGKNVKEKMPPTANEKKAFAAAIVNAFKELTIKVGKDKLALRDEFREK